MAQQIRENLWQVGGDGHTGGGDAAAYLICFGERAALIDAGTGSRHTHLAANIDTCLPSDVSLDYLILTQGSAVPTAEAVAATKYSLPRGRWVNSRRDSIKSHMIEDGSAVTDRVDAVVVGGGGVCTGAVGLSVSQAKAKKNGTKAMA